METITLNKAVDFGGGKRFERIELREMTAGDFMEALRALPDGASRMEQELRCASLCSDVPFKVFEAMHPADMMAFSAWYDRQWAIPADDASGENDAEAEASPGKAGKPSPGSAAPPDETA